MCSAQLLKTNSVPRALVSGGEFEVNKAPICSSSAVINFDLNCYTLRKSTSLPYGAILFGKIRLGRRIRSPHCEQPFLTASAGVTLHISHPVPIHTQPDPSPRPRRPLDVNFSRPVPGDLEILLLSLTRLSSSWPAASVFLPRQPCRFQALSRTCPSGTQTGFAGAAMPPSRPSMTAHRTSRWPSRTLVRLPPA
jgi:hypothetical protein